MVGFHAPVVHVSTSPWEFWQGMVLCTQVRGCLATSPPWRSENASVKSPGSSGTFPVSLAPLVQTMRWQIPCAWMILQLCTAFGSQWSLLSELSRYLCPHKTVMSYNWPSLTRYRAQILVLCKRAVVCMLQNHTLYFMRWIFHANETLDLRRKDGGCRIPRGERPLKLADEDSGVVWDSNDIW